MDRIYGWEVGVRTESEFSYCDEAERGRNAEQLAGRHVFLLEAFVQTERNGMRRLGGVLLREGRPGCQGAGYLCLLCKDSVIGKGFEIEKELNGKECAIHCQEQGEMGEPV